MNTVALKRPFKHWMHFALMRPWTYILAGISILALDYITGKYIMFPILFVIPVTSAAWFYTKRCAYSLAVLLPLCRFIIANCFSNPDPILFLAINTFIRIAVLGFLAFLVARTARQTKELEREVKLLEGILPICMFCKRIRDDNQNWQKLESYISKKSEAKFSHGLCPECEEKHYGDLSNNNQTA